jgi:hypothetical protein
MPGKVAHQPLRFAIVFLRQQPEVVTNVQNTLQQFARLACLTSHGQAIGEPAGAGDECAFVFACAGKPAPQDQFVFRQITLDGRNSWCPPFPSR